MPSSRIEGAMLIETTVTCPRCQHKQIEKRAPDDKFAWICKNCEAAIEGDKLHLLQEDAVFTGPRGNVCTGFGGKPGQLYHERIRE